MCDPKFTMSTIFLSRSSAVMNEKHEALIIQNFATLRDCEHNCKVPDSSSKKALLWSAHIITTNYSRNVGVPLARGKIVERDELLLSLLSTCFTVRSSLSRSPEKMSVYGVEMKAEGKKTNGKTFFCSTFILSLACLPAYHAQHPNPINNLS